MAKIKSFSTNNGDMFYIKHDSDNFTIIDCCIDNGMEEKIIDELKNESKEKNIHRFISTHPDDDHIRGLKYLNEKCLIVNFYCVKNETKKEDPSDDFKEYCKLRDDTKKAFYLSKGCQRRWMNLPDDERDSSNINILWPDLDNEYFKEALEEAKNSGEPNNICPIITYEKKNNISVYWLGDLKTEYMDSIKDSVEWLEADVLFAPHHGRTSGKVPKEILERIKPKVIIIGEAESEHLDYYEGYETITQNSAEDIVIVCEGDTADFYVKNENYDKKLATLKILSGKLLDGYRYIGSLTYYE